MAPHPEEAVFASLFKQATTRSQSKNLTEREKRARQKEERSQTPQTKVTVKDIPSKADASRKKFEELKEQILNLDNTDVQQQIEQLKKIDARNSLIVIQQRKQAEAKAEAERQQAEAKAQAERKQAEAEAEAERKKAEAKAEDERQQKEAERQRQAKEERQRQQAETQSQSIESQNHPSVFETMLGQLQEVDNTEEKNRETTSVNKEPRRIQLQPVPATTEPRRIQPQTVQETTVAEQFPKTNEPQPVQEITVTGQAPRANEPQPVQETMVTEPVQAFVPVQAPAPSPPAPPPQPPSTSCSSAGMRKLEGSFTLWEAFAKAIKNTSAQSLAAFAGERQLSGNQALIALAKHHKINVCLDGEMFQGVQPGMLSWMKSQTPILHLETAAGSGKYHILVKSNPPAVAPAMAPATADNMANMARAFQPSYEKRKEQQVHIKSLEEQYKEQTRQNRLFNIDNDLKQCEINLRKWQSLVQRPPATVQAPVQEPVQSVTLGTADDRLKQVLEKLANAGLTQPNINLKTVGSQLKTHLGANLPLLGSWQFNKSACERCNLESLGDGFASIRSELETACKQKTGFQNIITSHPELPQPVKEVLSLSDRKGCLVVNRDKVLMPFQYLVGAMMAPGNRIRGLMTLHPPGSGKTCVGVAAINTLKAVQNNPYKRVYIVVPNTEMKESWLGAIKCTCGSQDVVQSMTDDTKKEFKIGDITVQICALTLANEKRWSGFGSDRSLEQSLIIFDETHKMSSRQGTNTLGLINAVQWRDYINKARDCKVLLLTATPIEEKYETSILNLIKPRDQNGNILDPFPDERWLPSRKPEGEFGHYLPFGSALVDRNNQTSKQAFEHKQQRWRELFENNGQLNVDRMKDYCYGLCSYVDIEHAARAPERGPFPAIRTSGCDFHVDTAGMMTITPNANLCSLQQPVEQSNRAEDMVEFDVVRVEATDDERPNLVKKKMSEKEVASHATGRISLNAGYKGTGGDSRCNSKVRAAIQLILQLGKTGGGLPIPEAACSSTQASSFNIRSSGVVGRSERAVKQAIRVETGKGTVSIKNLINELMQNKIKVCDWQNLPPLTINDEQDECQRKRKLKQLKDSIKREAREARQNWSQVWVSFEAIGATSSSLISEAMKQCFNEDKEDLFDGIIYGNSAETGQSFFRVTHLHRLQPPRSKSNRNQSNARIRRLDSHCDLPEAQRYTRIFQYLGVSGNSPTFDTLQHKKVIDDTVSMKDLVVNCMKSTAIDCPLFSDINGVTRVVDRFNAAAPLDKGDQRTPPFSTLRCASYNWKMFARFEPFKPLEGIVSFMPIYSSSQQPAVVQGTSNLPAEQQCRRVNGSAFFRMPTDWTQSLETAFQELYVEEETTRRRATNPNIQVLPLDADDVEQAIEKVKHWLRPDPNTPSKEAWEVLMAGNSLWVKMGGVSSNSPETRWMKVKYADTVTAMEHKETQSAYYRQGRFMDMVTEAWQKASRRVAVQNANSEEISPWTLNGVYNRSHIYKSYIWWLHDRLMDSLRNTSITPNLSILPTLSQVQGFRSRFNQQVETQLRHITQPPQKQGVVVNAGLQKWKEAEARWALLGEIPTKHLNHANQQQREHLLWLLKHVRSLFPASAQTDAWRTIYVSARVMKETQKCKELVAIKESLTPTETGRWKGLKSLIDAVVNRVIDLA